MKTILRSVLSFLERKFPDRVVVRQAEYEALRDVQTGTREKVLAIEERIKALETQMANVNVSMGIAAPRINVLER